MYRAYFFLMIVAVLCNAGFCIKCYNCISTGNKECEDPSSHSDLKPQECSAELLKNLSHQVKNYAKSIGDVLGIDIDNSKTDMNIPIVCQKIVTTVGDNKVIIRSCDMRESSSMKTCENIGKRIDGTVTHCSQCESDGCNSGHWMVPLSMSSLLLPVLGLSLWTLMSS